MDLYRIISLNIHGGNLLKGHTLVDKLPQYSLMQDTLQTG